ncbi:hypothetical protein PSPO01_09666 [Paraphaeosphaeria sporulosa]
MQPSYARLCRLPPTSQSPLITGPMLCGLPSFIIVQPLCGVWDSGEEGQNRGQQKASLAMTDARETETATLSNALGRTCHRGPQHLWTRIQLQPPVASKGWDSNSVQRRRTNMSLNLSTIMSKGTIAASNSLQKADGTGLAETDRQGRSMHTNHAKGGSHRGWCSDWIFVMYSDG